jgi:hypothetical protein
MDVLIAIIGLIAAVLAVVASVLPLYIAYRDERKKLKAGQRPRDIEQPQSQQPEM